ncbi:hypothetical protein D3C74_401710 [compost metagenome]
MHSGIKLIARNRRLEFLQCADQHANIKSECLLDCPTDHSLKFSGLGFIALKHYIPGLDIGAHPAIPQRLEHGLQGLHLNDFVAAHVDASQQRNICNHNSTFFL